MTLSLSYCISMQCEGDCCGEMRRHRNVSCAVVSSSGELVTFPDRECNATTRPETSIACERTDCPRWQTSDWGHCSSTCGNGNRFRDVQCVQGDRGQRLPDSSCECSQLKPPVVQSCPNLPPCAFGKLINPHSY